MGLSKIETSKPSTSSKRFISIGNSNPYLASSGGTFLVENSILFAVKPGLENSTKYTASGGSSNVNSPVGAVVTVFHTAPFRLMVMVTPSNLFLVSSFFTVPFTSSFHCAFTSNGELSTVVNSTRKKIIFCFLNSIKITYKYRNFIFKNENRPLKV